MGDYWEGRNQGSAGGGFDANTDMQGYYDGQHERRLREDEAEQARRQAEGARAGRAAGAYSSSVSHQSGAGLLQLCAIIALGTMVARNGQGLLSMGASLAAMLLIAAGLSAASLPAIGRGAPSASRWSLLRRCGLWNATSAMFYAAAFAFLRDVAQSPKSAEQVAEANGAVRFVIDTVYAGGELVRALSDMAGQSPAMRAVEASAYHAGPSGYVMALILLLGLPALAYAFILRSLMGFGRALLFSLVSQSVLFAAVVCVLSLMQGQFGFRLFA